MAKTRECCSALSLRRAGDDLHVSLHKGFKIRLAGIVPVSLEFTGRNSGPPWPPYLASLGDLKISLQIYI